MEQAFDAYHKWLGIPPDLQPPDHYRLLGLQTFESDPDVIQAVADQRMMQLRAYQTGKNSEWSQRLLNEVAAARVCLLNGAKKAAYDQALRESLASSVPEAQMPAVAEPSNSALSFVSDVLGSGPRVSVSPYVRRRKRVSLGPFIISLAAVAVLLIAGLVYWVVLHGGLPTVMIPEQNPASPQSGAHGATSKPANGKAAVEPGRKAEKVPAKRSSGERAVSD